MLLSGKMDDRLEEALGHMHVFKLPAQHRQNILMGMPGLITDELRMFLGRFDAQITETRDRFPDFRW